MPRQITYRLGAAEHDGPQLRLVAQHHTQVTWARLRGARDYHALLATAAEVRPGTVNWDRWETRFSTVAYAERALLGTTECAVCGRQGDVENLELWRSQFPDYDNGGITCRRDGCEHVAVCVSCEEHIDLVQDDGPTYGWLSVPRVRTDEYPSLSGHVIVCTDCNGDTDYVGRCRTCATRWLENDAEFWNEEEGTDSCAGCASEIAERAMRLCSWSARFDHILPNLPKLRQGVPYLGVELELCTDPSQSLGMVAEQLAPCLDLKAFIKTDSSIGHGLEFVTRPMEYAEHKEWWPSVMETLSTQGRVEKSCGVHVHVSRSALSPLQLGKMLVFVNQEENSELMAFIAGRSTGQYNRACVKTYTDIFKENTNRYETLNLTNTKTVEFRMFGATLETAVMLSYLQFIMSLLAFTTPGSAGIKQLTRPDPYLAFVTKLGRDGFGELNKRLREGDWV